jgi:hypothetical protein
MIATAAAVVSASLAVQTCGASVMAAVIRGRNIYGTVIAVSGITAPAVVGFGAWSLGLGNDGLVFLAVLHLALGGLLFHFMTLPDRSVTLRLLVELLMAPQHTLAMADLTRRYSLQAMIESRLRQLAAARFLTMGAEGNIQLLPRGVAFGRFVTAGRRLFRIQSAN